MDYYKSFYDLGHDRRLIAKKGEKLPRRPIGPHTTQSFTTEWRGCLFTVWGATNYDYSDESTSSTERAGWLPEMTKDFEGGRIDPARTDGKRAVLGSKRRELSEADRGPLASRQQSVRSSRIAKRGERRGSAGLLGSHSRGSACRLRTEAGGR